jgi:hypothetical protein
VAFTPAEVDFLFPGPFSRRQLLGYKIARSAFSALFTATLFSFVFLRYAQHWMGGWIAIFLGLLFVQLLAMAIVLIGQTMGERAFTGGRKLALAVCLMAVAAIVLPYRMSNAPFDGQLIVHNFVNSPSGQIILTPFSVFGKILTANPIAPDAFKWTGVAIAMIGVLLIIVMRLDAHYLEAAAKSGQKIYDRTQRFRRGGGLAYRATSARLRIGVLPRLGGAGPIAWRQLNTAVRTAKAMLVVLLVISVTIGPMLFLGTQRGSNQVDPDFENVIIGAVFWVSFMLSNMLRFDFRGDLDLIDTLKALPIRNSVIALAELVAPVVVLVICQIILLTSIGVVLHRDPRMLAMIMLLAVPLDAILIAVENLIFLLFPVRQAVVSPGDLQGFGRQMLVFMLKTLMLLFAASLAAGLGAAAWWLRERSVPAFVMTTFVMLIIEFVAMIPLLVLAFQKFDPSVDTPA